MAATTACARFAQAGCTGTMPCLLPSAASLRAVPARHIQSLIPVSDRFKNWESRVVTAAKPMRAHPNRIHRDCALCNAAMHSPAASWIALPACGTHFSSCVIAERREGNDRIVAASAACAIFFWAVALHIAIDSLLGGTACVDMMESPSIFSAPGALSWPS